MSGGTFIDIIFVAYKTCYVISRHSWPLNPYLDQMSVQLTQFRIQKSRRTVTNAKESSPEIGVILFWQPCKLSWSLHTQTDLHLSHTKKNSSFGAQSGHVTGEITCGLMRRKSQFNFQMLHYRQLKLLNTTVNLVLKNVIFFAFFLLLFLCRRPIQVGTGGLGPRILEIPIVCQKWVFNPNFQTSF